MGAPTGLGGEVRRKGGIEDGENGEKGTMVPALDGAGIEGGEREQGNSENRTRCGGRMRPRLGGRWQTTSWNTTFTGWCVGGEHRLTVTALTAGRTLGDRKIPVSSSELDSPILFQSIRFLSQN